jgi:archaetidylinositol phosphate synthase
MRISGWDHMLGALKDNIRKWFLPLARNIPLSPNSLTMLGLLVSIISAFQFARGFLVLGALTILLSGLFDIFDGAVARANGLSTAFGAVLDSVCDRYADAMIFAGIIYGLISGNIILVDFLLIPMWLWAVIAIIGSYLVSYTRSRAEAAGAKEMDIGIAERPERLLVLVAGALTGMLGLAIVIIVILTHVTVVQRLLHAKRSLA